MNILRNHKTGCYTDGKPEDNNEIVHFVCQGIPDNDFEVIVNHVVGSG